MKEQVADIVAAYLKNNSVPVDQVPGLIDSVYAVLSGLSGDTPIPIAASAPAVAIRQSIHPDYLVCLACGKKSKMLKRHLTAAHAVTVQEYRTRWGLSADYPIVAKNSSERRSALAKSLGFGLKGSGRKRKSS